MRFFAADVGCIAATVAFLLLRRLQRRLRILLLLVAADSIAAGIVGATAVLAAVKNGVS